MHVRNRTDDLFTLGTHLGEYLSVKKFAAVMRYKERDVRAQIEKGALPAVRIGRTCRIRLVDACHYEGIEPAESTMALFQGIDPQRLVGVYFLQCGQYVKIGYASDVRDRVLQLGAVIPFPLQLLAVLVLDGPYDRLARTEKLLHARFAPLHFRGEWFHAEPDLLAFIQSGLDGWRAGATPVYPSPHGLSTDQARHPSRAADWTIRPYSAPGSRTARLAV